jgi:hypothetical protein
LLLSCSWALPRFDQDLDLEPEGDLLLLPPWWFPRSAFPAEKPALFDPSDLDLECDPLCDPEFGASKYYGFINVLQGFFLYKLKFA